MLDKIGVKSIQEGKTVVVTGATSGIGLALAGCLVKQGVAVIGIGRSQARGQLALAALRRDHPDAQVAFITADLGLQSEVRQAARAIGSILHEWEQPGLDALVNNAGTFTYWMELTPEGFERQWAVNHLAGFLLTHQLLPWLRARPGARVVNVSSDSHYAGRIQWEDLQRRRRYQGLQMYEQTKLANVLFAGELNRRLGAGSGPRAFAADPGLVKTDIGLKGTPGLVGWIWERRRSAGIPAAEAARWIAALALEPAFEESGELYWKHGKGKTASRAARDTEMARRLWAVSEQMCGIEGW